MSSVTFAAPATRPRRPSNVADAVLAAAVEVARAAAAETAGAPQIGEHLGVRAEDQRLVTHYFASAAPGYVGWRWAVTLARAPRARTGTVCEVALLPGDGAIVAPAWLPWSERLKPSDIGGEDLLPYIEDDPRLMPGFEETGDDDVDRLGVDELGLGRVRVISPLGRDEAATRWYEGDRGPIAPRGREPGGSGARRSRAKALAPQCATCGFLLLMAGSMRTLFGVCSNEWSPEDGRVVSLDHGCGAHSESDVERATSDWPTPAPFIDDHDVEFVVHVDEQESPSDEQESPADEQESPAEPDRSEDAGQPENGVSATARAGAEDESQPASEPPTAAETQASEDAESVGELPASEGMPLPDEAQVEGEASGSADAPSPDRTPPTDATLAPDDTRAASDAE